MRQTNLQVNTYPMLINGESLYGQSGQFVEIFCPFDGGLVGRVPDVTTVEVDAAYQAAVEAQKNWAQQPLHYRSQLLHKWAANLEAMSEELSEAIMLEVGKKKSAAKDEVARTADLIRYTAEEGIRIQGQRVNGDSFTGGSRSKLALVERVPLGVVLAISPFNYPVNLSASKVAPAVIAGNSVVLKPATNGAISASLMAQAFTDAGFPAGLLNVVTGRGSDIGTYLVRHPAVKMVSFTGGTATGEQISKQASMVPQVLELGGKDPAIVLEDADLELAAKEIVKGAFSYSGQRCTAIKRVLVLDAVADELVTKIASQVQTLKVGSPETDADIVPLINAKAADFVAGLIEDAIRDGATLICGNQRQGNLLYPTLLDNVTRDMRLAWEEPFGPVLPIIRVRTKEEAIQLTNASVYGLQASIFTQNVDAAFSLAAQIEAGTVNINGRTERGPDHFPFLGTKSSGTGTQGIRNSVESMTRERVLVLNLGTSM